MSRYPLNLCLVVANKSSKNRKVVFEDYVVLSSLVSKNKKTAEKGKKKVIEKKKK